MCDTLVDLYNTYVSYASAFVSDDTYV